MTTARRVLEAIIVNINAFSFFMISLPGRIGSLNTFISMRPSLKYEKRKH